MDTTTNLQKARDCQGRAIKWGILGDGTRAAWWADSAAFWHGYAVRELGSAPSCMNCDAGKTIYATDRYPAGSPCWNCGGGATD